jgi:hypothetical protein
MINWVKIIEIQSSKMRVQLCLKVIIIVYYVQ